VYDLADALAFSSSLRDDQDFQPRQPVDLQLEDGVGLVSRRARIALMDASRGVRLAPRNLRTIFRISRRSTEDLLEAPFEDVDLA